MLTLKQLEQDCIREYMAQRTRQVNQDRTLKKDLWAAQVREHQRHAADKAVDHLDNYDLIQIFQSDPSLLESVTLSSDPENISLTSAIKSSLSSELQGTLGELEMELQPLDGAIGSIGPRWDRYLEKKQEEIVASRVKAVEPEMAPEPPKPGLPRAEKTDVRHHSLAVSIGQASDSMLQKREQYQQVMR